eukprot:930108_1
MLTVDCAGGWALVIGSGIALMVLIVGCVFCVKKHQKQRKEWSEPKQYEGGPSYNPDEGDFEMMNTIDVENAAREGGSPSVGGAPEHITKNKWKSAWEIEQELAAAKREISEGDGTMALDRVKSNSDMPQDEKSEGDEDTEDDWETEEDEKDEDEKSEGDEDTEDDWETEEDEKDEDEKSEGD